MVSAAKCRQTGQYHLPDDFAVIYARRRAVRRAASDSPAGFAADDFGRGIIRRIRVKFAVDITLSCISASRHGR